MAENRDGWHVRPWRTGVATVCLILLVVGYITHNGAAKLGITVLLIGTLVGAGLEYRARLVTACCPHDGVALAVAWQLPRPQLTCPACRRRYSLYGPQLYEHREPGSAGPEASD